MAADLNEQEQALLERIIQQELEMNDVCGEELEGVVPANATLHERVELIQNLAVRLLGRRVKWSREP